MLIAARAETADVDLMHQLSYAERTFLRANVSDHDDFLAQQAWLSPKADNALKQKYQELYQAILWFLQSVFAKDNQAWSQLQALPNTEYLPAQAIPPKMKTFYAHMARDGVKKAVEWCKQGEMEEAIQRLELVR